MLHQMVGSPSEFLQSAARTFLTEVLDIGKHGRAAKEQYGIVPGVPVLARGPIS